MDKLERYANGWSKAEMDAFNIVMADPAMPDYKNPDYDDWLFHKAWQAALAAAPTPPAQTGLKVEFTKDWCMKMAQLEGDSEIGAGSPTQDREVGILYVSLFRGHLENFHFDYYGDLPEGSHALYTAPQSDKLRKAAEELLCALETSEHIPIDLVENLRAALEGK